MKDRTFNYIRKIIQDILEEDVSAISAPTNSLSSGKIAGTSEAGDLPPVDLRKKKYKKLPLFYKDMFRRKTSVQSKRTI